MNFMEIKLVDAFAVLILAGRKSIEDVPEHLREAVEIRQAEKVIEMTDRYNKKKEEEDAAKEEENK